MTKTQIYRDLVKGAIKNAVLKRMLAGDKELTRAAAYAIANDQANLAVGKTITRQMMEEIAAEVGGSYVVHDRSSRRNSKITWA